MIEDKFRIFPRGAEPRSVDVWPPAPPWRRGRGVIHKVRTDIPLAVKVAWVCSNDELMLQIDAAIHLRRPLLVTGNPGTGKSSLARAIAYRLELGKLLEWRINSRSTLQEGLYAYDAIRRVEDTGAPGRDVGRYLRLGPLGTAMLPGDRPRVLLIDEIDKSDVDLPNDLLHVFEEGEFYIPELRRDGRRKIKLRPDDGDGERPVEIHNGHVQCKEFPIVVLTSNGEREFPPAFRRRCVCVTLVPPSPAELDEIVRSHFKADAAAFTDLSALIEAFVARRKSGVVATDQLLNALHIRLRGGGSALDPVLLRPLTDSL
jgi:MoxR-like ATPase